MEAEDSVSGEKCMKTRVQEGTTEGTSESKMGRVSSDDSQFRNKVRKEAKPAYLDPEVAHGKKKRADGYCRPVGHEPGQGGQEEASEYGLEEQHRDQDSHREGAY